MTRPSSASPVASPRPQLARLMMGSVAEGAVRHASVPVIVVPCAKR
ncbi:MAG: universal stress protein [Candidatus Cybelea sp.]